ncbi:MAG: type I-E CRISPR-associated protein Cas6/Cse3/CasE [Deltaproteobacteria bacterium]|nr:type I-E CRISPR-associated protein Cas6/Cse3/CasE [Deltaproteobacteria bacterium]
MFLSRIELRADAAARPEFWRQVATPEGAHQALWRLFSRAPEQTRDFLFRQDVGGSRGPGRVSFFVLSKSPPRDDGAGLWHLEDPKPFAPRLCAGDRLRFSLRASPTVKRGTGADGTPGKRCDVVMDARKQHGAGEPFDVVLALQREGERWLARQAAKAGFDLARGPTEVVGEDGLVEEVERAALRVDGYRQHRLHRKGEAPIRFSTVDFEGVLVVRDPALFLAKVALGFGPQKAFGCGLMLLQRA